MAHSAPHARTSPRALRCVPFRPGPSVARPHPCRAGAPVCGGPRMTTTERRRTTPRSRVHRALPDAPRISACRRVSRAPLRAPPSLRPPPPSASHPTPHMLYMSLHLSLPLPRLLHVWLGCRVHASPGPAALGPALAQSSPLREHLSPGGERAPAVRPARPATCARPAGARDCVVVCGCLSVSACPRLLGQCGGLLRRRSGVAVAGLPSLPRCARTAGRRSSASARASLRRSQGSAPYRSGAAGGLPGRAAALRRRPPLGPAAGRGSRRGARLEAVSAGPPGAAARHCPAGQPRDRRPAAGVPLVLARRALAPGPVG